MNKKKTSLCETVAMASLQVANVHVSAFRKELTVMAVTTVSSQDVSANTANVS